MFLTNHTYFGSYQKLPVSVPGGKKCCVWYTNRSKMDKSTGADGYCPDEHIRYFSSLRKFSTIFLAEVYAVLMCCEICFDKGYMVFTSGRIARRHFLP